VTVDWGNNANNTKFNVDLEIVAYDRSSLLRDLTDLFATEKLNINGLRTVCKNNKAFMVFTLQVKGGNYNFAGLIDKIFMVSGVVEVQRK
jgi:GTP pyrophosphokinase